MADLLAMSADIIDGRVAPNELGPLNRINHQLSELSIKLEAFEDLQKIQQQEQEFSERLK